MNSPVLAWFLSMSWETGFLNLACQWSMGPLCWTSGSLVGALLHLGVHRARVDGVFPALAETDTISPAQEADDSLAFVPPFERLRIPSVSLAVSGTDELYQGCPRVQNKHVPAYLQGI
jgi:hypothetical protein